jgi:hypothetical protein
MEVLESSGSSQNPDFNDVMDMLGPLPNDALFIGVASDDNLPVLLNIHDYHPGPLLIVGQDNIKTRDLLKVMAKHCITNHPPSNLQFGVICNYADKWETLKNNKHCVGIFEPYKSITSDFICASVGWAINKRGAQQTLLVLVENLVDILELDFDVRQSFNWLLHRGPIHRVWPIVAINSKDLSSVKEILTVFHTVIFSYPTHFEFKENGKMLKFWIPRV